MYTNRIKLTIIASNMHYKQACQQIGATNKTLKAYISKKKLLNSISFEPFDESSSFFWEYT